MGLVYPTTLWGHTVMDGKDAGAPAKVKLDYVLLLQMLVR